MLATTTKNRWNPFKNEPIRDSGALCYVLRKIVNSHPARIEFIKELLKIHNKIIVFYNFDYELDILRTLSELTNVSVAEYNGHKHQDIPKTESWVYLVQYTSGAEGWNCIETNVVVFFSQSYSYKVMIQAAGRIDRLNTPFIELFYYTLRSESSIDSSIAKALRNKKKFNEHNFDITLKE